MPEALIPLLDPTIEADEDVESHVGCVLLVVTALLARGGADALRRAGALLATLRRLLARLLACV